ncbi:hypothetical protein BSK71_07740 [Pectobacterium actinidiae]|uniref:DUF4760 domain-containing protein n=1 Tax=Pectobacterium actinidiae TaxID=1507808 RepID=A0A1V2R5C9_9GAMM|nr:hypothetical protein [Pectobacterium actinidiae]ONK04943.1 hypothetical protein BSK69_07460 [Pectobacterium actinidiae]ONK07565.1 hypothetical protein BSK71_07740 [Pectobacterium actinidiae]
MSDDTWVMLGAIGSCLAALATFFAAIVAILAMKSWKKQEKTKAYQKYKMSIEGFKAELNILSDSFSNKNSHSTYSGSDPLRPDAIRAFAKCQVAWIGYEIYSATQEQSHAWETLSNSANGYLFGGRKKNELLAPINTVLSIKQEVRICRFGKMLAQVKTSCKL